MSDPNFCQSCDRALPADAPGGLCPACVLRGAAESLTPPPGPAIEEVQGAFPHLEILECIGRGGMGIVYKAFQPRLGRHVALKVLDPDLRANPDFAERFEREAKFLGKLAHPNIVTIHDFGETAGYFWLMMEFVDGVNLRQAMQAGRFSPAQALAIIPEICKALGFAHEHGVLHRDIKPENILLDSRGHVRIADFGIARLSSGSNDFTLTQTGTRLGSAAYVAPELIEAREIDHRADIYSLGVVFYEMLTGELPLGRFPAPSEKSSSDPRLDEVVFRALEKDRERRYQSAEEVKTGVERHADLPKAGVTSSAAPLEKLPVMASVKLPLCLIGGGVLLLVALIFSLQEELGLYFLRLLIFRARYLVLDVTPGFGMFLRLWFGAGIVMTISGFALAFRALYRKSRGIDPPGGWGLLTAFGLWPAVVIFAGYALRLLAGESPTVFGDLEGLPAAGLVMIGAVVLGFCIQGMLHVPGDRGRGLKYRFSGPSTTTDGLLRLTFVFSLIAGGLLGMAASMESGIAAILGGAFLALGLAGSWIALWRMKTATMSLNKRPMLLALGVWLPTITAAVFFAKIIERSPLMSFHGKGDYFINVSLAFALSFLIATPLFWLSSLPRRMRISSKWIRSIMLVISLSLAAFALIAAKRLDGHWPTVYRYEEIKFALRYSPSREGSSTRDGELVRAMVTRAAEPYGTQFRLVSAGDWHWTVGMMARDEVSWLRLRDYYQQRLEALLPPEIGSQVDLRADNYSRGMAYPQAGPAKFDFSILLAAGMSAVIAAWCLLPLSMLPAAAMLFGSILMIVTPVWKFRGSQDERLIDGPLPAPIKREAGVADFSTSVAAAQSVFNAAWAGDLEVVKRGFSEKIRQRIEAADQWQMVMRWFSQRSFVHSKSANAPTAGGRREWAYFENPYSRGQLQMLLEGGEWRVDALPFKLILKP